MIFFEIKTVTIIKIKKESKFFKNFFCEIIKLDMVATLPGNLEKHGKIWNLTIKAKKKLGKTLNFRNFEKNLEKSGFLNKNH